MLQAEEKNGRRDDVDDGLLRKLISMFDGRFLFATKSTISSKYKNILELTGH